MPSDEMIIAASEYQVFHTHSGFPEVAVFASGLKGLKVVESLWTRCLYRLKNLYLYGRRS